LRLKFNIKDCVERVNLTREGKKPEAAGAASRFHARSFLGEGLGQSEHQSTTKETQLRKRIFYPGFANKVLRTRFCEQALANKPANRLRTSICGEDCAQEKLAAGGVPPQPHPCLIPRLASAAEMAAPNARSRRRERNKDFEPQSSQRTSAEDAEKIVFLRMKSA
jgi:hypothetical protein